MTNPFGQQVIWRPHSHPLTTAIVVFIFATAFWPTASLAQEPKPVKLGACHASEVFVLALHGGAVWGRYKHARKVAAVEKALAEGRDLLEAGATSLDVVHATLRAMENSGVFNAGRGAIANQAGKIEMDASIMDGQNLDAGAVASIGGVKNPISAARLVMDDSPHVMMVGPSADEFAKAKGANMVKASYFLKSGLAFADVPLPSNIEIVAPGDDVPADLARFSGSWAGLWSGAMTTILVVERLTADGADVIIAHGPNEDWGYDEGSWSRFPAVFSDGGLRIKFDQPASTVTYRLGPDGVLEAFYKADSGVRDHATLKRWDVGPTAKNRGTVGAVALDRCGDLAAGTSTGGFGSKTPGRVGDSPIIGAGTYANNETAAVSATGHGEYFIRFVVGHDISALMAYGGLSLEDAANRVIHQKLKPLGAKGGVIALDRQGKVATPFNTDGMVRGVVRNDTEPQVSVYE